MSNRKYTVEVTEILKRRVVLSAPSKKVAGALVKAGPLAYLKAVIDEKTISVRMIEMKVNQGDHREQKTSDARTIYRNWRGIEKVTSEQVARFLTDKGWHQISYDDPTTIVYRSPERYVVELPVGTYSDDISRLYEAIDRIAQIEDAPTYVVLQRFAQEVAE